MTPLPLSGIVIGALLGGTCFVVFGVMRAAYSGSFSVLTVLHKFSGKPVRPTVLVRIMVAAGILLSIVLGIAVSMVLGGAVGGVIEHLVMKMS